LTGDAGATAGATAYRTDATAGATALPCCPALNDRRAPLTMWTAVNNGIDP